MNANLRLILMIAFTFSTCVIAQVRTLVKETEKAKQLRSEIARLDEKASHLTENEKSAYAKISSRNSIGKLVLMDCKKTRD